MFYALNLTKPLVKMLRLVDGEKNSPMWYIYEVIDRAKDFTARTFNDRDKSYKDAFEIMYRRWNYQLHHPLHAAEYFLNS